MQAIKDWVLLCFKAMDAHLAEKNYMFGYCGGAYYLTHWALAHPERVMKVFLHSPICLESPPEDFDKFKQRFDDRSIAPPAEWFIKEGDFDDDPELWTRRNQDNSAVLDVF